MEVASFRKKELISNYVILGIFAIVSLAPILVLIFNAFKPAVEFGTNPIGLPNNITSKANIQKYFLILLN